MTTLFIILLVQIGINETFNKHKELQNNADNLFQDFQARQTRTYVVQCLRFSEVLNQWQLQSKC